MIIDSMSIEEMQKEVKKDIDSLYTKIYYLFAENRRFFVKSKKFPIYKIFSWKSRVTQIEWNIIILARKKKEQTIPKIIPYVRYQFLRNGNFLCSTNGRGGYDNNFYSTLYQTLS